MKIISIVNQKGGTGKTTTVLNLSSCLANFGQKVLVIDLDPQANTTSGFGVNNFQKTIYEILSQEASLLESLVKIKENLFLIPVNESLAGANIELVSEKDREFKLAKILEPLPLDFDFVFIDTPPSLGLLTINSLVASQFSLIPVQAEYFALEGLGQLINTINLIKESLNPKLEILGVVITMYDERARLAQEVLFELYKNFPFRIFRTVIPRSIKLAEAPSFGQTIFEYAPNSKAAKAYRRLAIEFLHYN
ncbi:MAG: ParA family protein [Patescibacteria group bacterium]|nr:ParA family protein [Patescibacteria group bacterium]